MRHNVILSSSFVVPPSTWKCLVFQILLPSLLCLDLIPFSPFFASSLANYILSWDANTVDEMWQWNMTCGNHFCALAETILYKLWSVLSQNMTYFQTQATWKSSAHGPHIHCVPLICIQNLSFFKMLCDLLFLPCSSFMLSVFVGQLSSSLQTQQNGCLF